MKIMNMRNLNCLFAVLIILSGFSLFTLYSCTEEVTGQIEYSLDRVSAIALRNCPEVTVNVVNEVEKAEVTIQDLILKDVSYLRDKGQDDENGIIQKIDYNIVLGATKVCFPVFPLKKNIPEECCLEVTVSFVPYAKGETAKRKVQFRYNLEEAMNGQFVFGLNPHIGITMVLLETEEGSFDADWLVTEL